MTVKANQSWARGLLRTVRSAVDSLPSDEEVRLSVHAIDELIAFLQKLRLHLVSQPTAGQREDVERAIVVLESFLSGSRGPLMLASPKGGRPRPSDLSSDVVELRRTLQALDLDEIRLRLQDGATYSTRLLRNLARELGLRLDSRISRDDLVDAIVKRGFANPRAYEGLRGNNTQTPTDDVPKKDSST